MRRYAQERLHNVAEEALRSSERFAVMRPETLWLQERYERLRRSTQLSKAELDRFLYEKTFAEAADKPACAQRIRFWRTGRYYPKNRPLCVSFARALELDEEERAVCLQAWYDHSDRCFSKRDVEDPLYQRRRSLMDMLAQEFLDKVPPAELDALCAPGTTARQNLRHIYCAKAAEFVSLPEAMDASTFISSRHLNDATYAERFACEMSVLGEISRTTMIRHLLLLGMPFVSGKLMSERLVSLGYRPLDPQNSDRGGQAIDALVLGVLALYDEECAGCDPEVCMAWLREAWSSLDAYLVERHAEGLCLFRFKHMRNRLQAGSR